MNLRSSSRSESVHSGAGPDVARGRAARSPRPRRGAAAMEYLFVISLILVAALTGIGYFGKSVQGKVEHSRDVILEATGGK